MDNEIKSDRGKIIGLIFVIICVVILIIGFFIIAILDLTSKESDTQKLSTTTRRSINVTEESEPKVEEDKEETTTTTTTEVITTSEVSTTSRVTATSVVVPTKKKVVTETTTKTQTHEEGYVKQETIVENMPSNEVRTVVTDATNYPNAIDTIEWDIVNYINQERKKNGLSELKVAGELRSLSEGGANEYCEKGNDSAVGAYLTGYSNYRTVTYTGVIDSYNLYFGAKSSTKVTTSSSLSYIGIGVIYKSCNFKTPGYYFVMTYE